MDGYSPNIAENLRKQLQVIAPEAFADGKLNVEALKRALGEEHVLEQGERYHLDWPGKSAAYKILQAPTSATLRPQPELSVNFDAAEHVFIEGENLEVLKVLQKAYFGKVKLIYIDPPYNTGSDSFIYPDKFQESKAGYLQRINALDDDGQLLREGFFRKNSKENGQYHSNWLNMILPRLYLARNLLREDGVIFVSIDDNEVHNLRCVMNEVFGEENFIAQFIWKARQFTDTRALTNVSTDHEYILAFSRTQEFSLRGVERDESKFSNPDNDLRGSWMSRSILGLATRDQRPNLHYDIFEPKTGRKFPPNPMTGWRYSREKMEELISDGRILFPSKEDGRPREKKFRCDMQSDFISFRSIIDDIHTANGTQEIRALFGSEVFGFPKPSGLIAKIAEQVMVAGDLMLDFFSGSGSSFEAIARLNVHDGKPRHCLLVQLPEPITIGSEAHKAGFNNIADIARERIRRVIQKIHDEADLASPVADNLGFKSFVLAPSNFKQWRGDDINNEEQLAQQLELFVKSEKNSADTQDILYELLLKAGFPLTVPIECLNVADSPVYSANDGQLLLALEAFTFDMIEPLIAMKPKEILCLDTVFHGYDELKTNLDLQCRDAGVIFTCV